MKRTVFVILVSGMIYGECVAQCVNEKHRKAQVVVVAGRHEKTEKYKCAVRSSENKNFDDGYCKKCGCHTSDHDNA